MTKLPRCYVFGVTQGFNHDPARGALSAWPGLCFAGVLESRTSSEGHVMACYLKGEFSRKHVCQLSVVRLFVFRGLQE